MKLIVCVLPLLCLVLYLNSVNAGISQPDMGKFREARSLEDVNEDLDVLTTDDDDSENEKDSGEISNGNDEDNDSVSETPGTKVLLKLNDKATNLFSNKSEEDINAIQKKLADLKYGFSRRR